MILEALIFPKDILFKVENIKSYYKVYCKIQGGISN